MLLASAGFTLMMNYETTPGVSANAPRKWPGNSGLKLNPRGLTLVMALHPMCSCSEASLGQLEEVLAENRMSGRKSSNQRDVQIYFLVPVLGDEQEWKSSPLVERAQGFPHATVVFTKDTSENLVFDAHTSGQTYLYDASGNLLFSGGLTRGRGVQTKSESASGLLRALSGEEKSSTSHQVFGCALDSKRTE